MNRLLLSILGFSFLAGVGVVLHSRVSPSIQEGKQARFLPVFEGLAETVTEKSLPPEKDANGLYPAVNTQRLAELEKSNYKGPAYREIIQPAGPNLAINAPSNNRVPASEHSAEKKSHKKSK